MAAKTPSRNVLYFFLLFVASFANSQDDFISNFSGNDPLYSETSTYSGIPEAAPYLDMNDLTEKERQLADTEQSLEDVSTLFCIILILDSLLTSSKKSSIVDVNNYDIVVNFFSYQP